MASGKLVGVVSWGYGCADSSYPGGKVNFEYRIQSFNPVRMHITVPANSRHFASAFILLVYARVASDAYTNFIIPHITKWSNPTTRPSNSWVKRLTSTTSEFKLGCTDKGGFYDSRGVNYNCMWYADDLTRCSTSRNTHAGVTANMACCACGGGGSDSIII